MTALDHQIQMSVRRDVANPTKYRQIHGTTSFTVSIPREFSEELKISHGSNVKLELVDGKIILTNADSVEESPAAEPKRKRA